MKDKIDGVLDFGRVIRSSVVVTPPSLLAYRQWSPVVAFQVGQLVVPSVDVEECGPDLRMTLIDASLWLAPPVLIILLPRRNMLIVCWCPSLPSPFLPFRRI